jgi:hypothetical protein
VTWDYGCETGKRRYATAADVRAAIRGHQKNHKHERPYRCNTCKGWHLTSYLHETRAKSRARTVFRRRHP